MKILNLSKAMKLYTYFRSSASYRVRIALNIKGIAAEVEYVNLLKGEQQGAGYAKLNPQKLVPALLIPSPRERGEDGRGEASLTQPSSGEGGHLLTQSLAIIEYLEEIHPTPPLLPKEPIDRARVRAIALAIACEIAPINNLRVLKYLTGELGVSEEAKTAWIQKWISVGFDGVEAMLAGSNQTGAFCHGDTPTMADCCLAPQVFNARRFDCDLTPYPTLTRIADHCNTLPAFIQAAPEHQADKI